MLATGAFAQSTGATVIDELVVTGSHGPKSLDGILAQTAPKTKTTIDQDFISRQIPGQTVLQALNVVPGLNFTNNDPYGNSGGNVRLRSFDCARISFQWDGVQLNDSGNYACFTNQVGDSEIISSAEVSQGTTDVDSPTGSAVGGSINYRTKTPDSKPGGHFDVQGGSYSYYRGFGEYDTGEIGPWKTRAFGAVSYTDYDKFKGLGKLEKLQFNGRLYQPIGENGDFVSLAAHYNRNRNNQYLNPTLAQYQQFGYRFDEDNACIRPTPQAGTIQNENNPPASGPVAGTSYSSVVDFLGNSVANKSCSGYYNTRINPSNTGNLRGQFKYHLLDNLIFTFDPNFQYVLANGGGFSVISETDNRLRGAAGPAGPGRDLNGDGDTLDSVAVYSPNNTNTRRYGINSSLIWDISPTQHVRVAYSLDYARHRQTAEFSPYDSTLNPLNVFAGKDGQGPKIPTNDGSFLRGRDRFSIAQLNQVAAEYFGTFLEDKVEVRLGVRAPFFKRDLNQFCYSQNGSSTVLCTTQAVTTVLPNGNVQFSGNANQFIRPYSRTVKYDKVLPNVGATYRFTDEQSVYASYAEGLSVPRTDNLYTVTRAANGQALNPGVQPESTQTVDVGYRFSRPKVQLTVDAYETKFQNRIASSFDQDLQVFIDRNIGAVDIKGVDAGIVAQVTDFLTYLGNVSYNDSNVKADSPLANGLFLPIKGKRIVETPEWQTYNRLDWSIDENIKVGLAFKYVGKRYATDVNDQFAKAYKTWDLDMRVKLPFLGGDRVYAQFNVSNLTDERYLGSISSQTNAITVPGSTGFAPTYALGAPRTFQASLHADF